MTEVEKHTPGPWKILRKRSMEMSGNFHQVTDSERYPAAFVPAWDNPGPGEEDGAEEAEANARLISAAPELLEVLLEAVANNMVVEGSAWWGRVSAAIAKATQAKP